MRNRIWIVAVLFVALSSALAQDETPLEVTVQNRAGDLPFSSSIGSDIEHVDVSSLNLVVRIPITHVKGRGLDFDLAFRWDGMFWIAATRFPPPPSPPVQVWNIDQRNYLVPNGVGWEPNQPRITWVASRFACGIQPWATGGIFWSHYIYHDADGGSHAMAVRQGAGDCDNGSFLLDDTAGPRPDLSVAGLTGGGSTPDIWESNGTQVAWHRPPGGAPPPGGVYDGSQAVFGTFADANGNTLQQYAGGLDTLGRTIVSQTNGTNQITYTIKDSSGTSQTYTVNYTSLALHTAFNVSGPYGPITEYAPTRNVVTSIVLPTGKSYSFQYETAGYGGLSRITLPSGGYIDYTWGTISAQDQTRRYVASRTVHTGGQSYQWTFSPQCQPGGLSPCTFAATTVTDPLSQQSVFSSGYGRITQAKIYSGAVGGTPLRQYDIIYTSYDDPVNQKSPQDAVPTTITTTLENGQVSQKQIDYQTTTFMWSGCQEDNPLGCAAMVDNNGNVIQTQKTATTGNVKEIREYDWGSGAPGALLRRTKFAYLQDSNSNYLTYHIIDKVVSKTVCTGTAACNGSGDQTELTQYQYDNYAATNPPDPLLASSGAAQHDYTNYSSVFTYRGNATQVLRWRNTDSSFLTTTYQYDDLGNIRGITTPVGNKTTWSYTDSWSGTACPPPTGFTGQAYPTQMTNPLSQVITRTYYPCTGLLQARKDQNDINNNRAGTTHTYDRMGRENAVSLADGGQTTTCYSDDPAQTGCYNGSSSLLTVTKTTKITSTMNLVSKILHDDIGREFETQLTSDPEGTTYVDTTFDALGRKASQYNPTRCNPATVNCGEPTWGVTGYQYDALNRTTRVTQADNTAVVTSYVGNTTTVTDEGSKARKSQTDGLGRLTFVWEDPNTLNYETDHAYDVLGNLIGVTQKGGAAQGSWRNRSFIYNSLSQLTSATNPESGTITYAYDADGNVASKTAPTPNKIPADTSGPLTLTTTFSYDALNRLKQKSYSDGTAAVTYGYDGVNPTGCTPPTISSPTNLVGRRSGMCDAAGSASWSYDPMGRALTEKRLLNTTVTKTIAYTYNLDGSPATLVYPGGRTVTYTPGAAGHPLAAQDVANSVNYVTAATYAPFGGTTGMINGVVAGSFTGIFTFNAYNQRLQPCRLSARISGLAPSQCSDNLHVGNVLDLTYDFHVGAGDNGDVYQITNNFDTNRTQNFTYDALNRIASAYTTSNFWGNTYQIDPWGNLLQKNGMAGKNQSEALTQTASTQNQFVGFCYDIAGNMLGVTGCPSLPYNPFYVYDAENRLRNLNFAASPQYLYDGDGKRVIKTGIGNMLYWTGIGSETLTETNLSGTPTADYIYFNGKRVARVDTPSGTATVRYYFSDHLGSASVVTDNLGVIKTASDFYPYGGERVVTSGDSNRYKFTGKERDTESGLDDFGARYYTSSLGRFMTPDEFSGGPVDLFESDETASAALPYADITEPQSLNKYAYTYNNPLRYIDPNGHYVAFDDVVAQAQVQRIMIESPSVRQEILKEAMDENFDVHFQQVGVQKLPNNAPADASASKDANGVVHMTIRVKPLDDKNTEHEIGHGEHARTKWDEFYKQGMDEQKDREAGQQKDHDSYPVEQHANQFRDRAEQERKQYHEQQKQKKKEMKRMPKKKTI